MDQILFEQIHDQLFQNGRCSTMNQWVPVTLQRDDETTNVEAFYPSRGNIRIRQYVGQIRLGDDMIQKRYQLYRFTNKKELLLEGFSYENVRI